jgi:formylglycine-generating enzyme required for sulfatase activity
VTVAGCRALEPDPLPPRGEALLVVDTDLPVPRVVSRLRIDVSTEDGRWLASRDDLRPDPRDWPTSFSVFADDPARPRVVVVRLRAYPDGRLVPYRGDARLDGAETPATEPDPTLTVDRTLRVPLRFGTRGRLVVTLRGACVGKADCDDAEPPLEPTMSRDVPSAVGSFARVSCEAASSTPARACIEGGAFVFGDEYFRPSASGDVRRVDARPERVLALSRFWMDKGEVTVARYRAAVARGFVAPAPVGASERDGPPGGDPTDACTWSALPRGREGYALSCVTWETADAFCREDGGDLPTEAQWEYAALAAGRSSKATYPWGDRPPTCNGAVYARADTSVLGRSECAFVGVGLPLADAPNEDVTPAGVRNLAGSLEEHLKDDHAAFTDGCWTRASRLDPVCLVPPPPECVPDVDTTACRAGPGIVKSRRGGSWIAGENSLRVVDRSDGAVVTKHGNGMSGFRCVYPSP